MVKNIQKKEKNLHSSTDFFSFFFLRTQKFLCIRIRMHTVHACMHIYACIWVSLIILWYVYGSTKVCVVQNMLFFDFFDDDDEEEGAEDYTFVQ